MAVLGGAIFRMPILSPVRLVALKQILVSLDWHKSRNVSSSCDFVVTFRFLPGADLTKIFFLFFPQIILSFLFFPYSQTFFTITTSNNSNNSHISHSADISPPGCLKQLWRKIKSPTIHQLT